MIGTCSRGHDNRRRPKPQARRKLTYGPKLATVAVFMLRVRNCGEVSDGPKTAVNRKDGQIGRPVWTQLRTGQIPKHLDFASAYRAATGLLILRQWIVRLSSGLGRNSARDGGYPMTPLPQKALSALVTLVLVVRIPRSSSPPTKKPLQEIADLPSTPPSQTRAQVFLPHSPTGHDGASQRIAFFSPTGTNYTG